MTTQELVTADDLFLFILTDGKVYDARLSAARLPMLHQRRKAFIKLARTGWKEYQKDFPGSIIASLTIHEAANRLLDDTALHVMELDAPEGKVFFIVDGIVGKGTTIGFILKYGQPVTNSGEVVGEFKRLSFALAMVPPGKVVYRVSLERYFRVQSIKQLRTEA